MSKLKHRLNHTQNNLNKILQSKKQSFQESVATAPKEPGCYIYKSSDGSVLYVGKAKMLRNRVKSYFSNFDKLDIRIQQMLEKAEIIETYIVDSEIEAFILENNLIKKYHPPYNIMMRDDKSYIFVRFEKFRNSNQKPSNTSTFQDFPRITITRQKNKDGAEYFGPFPDSMPAKRILTKLRRTFPYRTSTHLVYQISSDPLEVFTERAKPCFFYHLGLCEGACEGLESKEHYQKKFNNIRRFFAGDKSSILKPLERDLKQKVKKLEFEEAAKIRDKINDIKYLTSNIRIDNSVDDVVVQELKRSMDERGLEQLIEKLAFPGHAMKLKKSFRIECYDISNIQGTNAVGAMTVMVDGQIKPSLYRKFRIRMKNEPNDFAMLQEMLTRRLFNLFFAIRDNPEKYKDWLKKYDLNLNSFEDKNYSGGLNELNKKKDIKKLDESFSQIPDLIIVDGGKGQLASTYKILLNFDLHNKIPVVGLAKREEEIYKIKDQFSEDNLYVNDSNMFQRVLLPRRSQSLFIVQRVRDEAHRFGITYHRNLRSKGMIEK